MSEKEKSDTPRTDAVAETAFNACNTPGEVVFADFARELERENAGLRDLVERADDLLAIADAAMDGWDTAIAWHDDYKTLANERSKP